MTQLYMNISCIRVCPTLRMTDTKVECKMYQTYFLDIYQTL